MSGWLNLIGRGTERWQRLPNKERPLLQPPRNRNMLEKILCSICSESHYPFRAKPKYEKIATSCSNNSLTVHRAMSALGDTNKITCWANRSYSYKEKECKEVDRQKDMRSDKSERLESTINVVLESVWLVFCNAAWLCMWRTAQTLCFERHPADKVERGPLHLYSMTNPAAHWQSHKNHRMHSQEEAWHPVWALQGLRIMCRRLELDLALMSRIKL